MPDTATAITPVKPRKAKATGIAFLIKNPNCDKFSFVNALKRIPALN